MKVFRTLEKGQLVEILRGMVVEVVKRYDLENLVENVIPEDYPWFIECNAGEQAVADELYMWLEDEDVVERFIEYLGEEEVEMEVMSVLAERDEL